MVVIVILGLLATMVATNVVTVSDEARVHTTETSLKSLADGVRLFCVKNGKPPSSLEDLLDPALGGPFVEDLGEDAWGRSFVLRAGAANDFEIVSFGKDGNEGTEDDLSSRRKTE